MFQFEVIHQLWCDFILKGDLVLKWILFIYNISGCCVFSSYCQTQIKTQCQGSLCLYLYKAKNVRISWNQSLQVCKQNGLVMLMIESSEIQTLVERLLDDLDQGTQRQIWIGARRRSSNTWRYMNGTSFNKTGIYFPLYF